MNAAQRREPHSGLTENAELGSPPLGFYHSPLLHFFAGGLANGKEADF